MCLVVRGGQSIDVAIETGDEHDTALCHVGIMIAATKKRRPGLPASVAVRQVSSRQIAPTRRCGTGAVASGAKSSRVKMPS
jgi:hypothetical protein